MFLNIVFEYWYLIKEIEIRFQANNYITCYTIFIIFSISKENLFLFINSV